MTPIMRERERERERERGSERVKEERMAAIVGPCSSTKTCE